MANDSVRIENGWSLYGHPLFISRLSELLDEVESLAARKPKKFNQHPAFKLLQCVSDSMTSSVPNNPAHPDFRQGNTLGPENRHWMRVKKGLPTRYRLFFQYRSTAPRTIIYAWLNDDKTLRHKGAKTDVYVVFGKMLASGKVPSTFDALLAKADTLP